MSIALFAPVESDLNNINTARQNYTRYYEQEAIKCFSCWRKNAGWLSNIPIYAICPTQSVISVKTKKIFKTLNVTYIEEYMPETEEYKNGYWNIPLVGKWAENNLSEDLLIKIDLDMYLIKEMPKQLFSLSTLPLVGRYDDDSVKHHANQLNFPRHYGNPFDTGLVISSKKDFFYSTFFKTLKQLTAEYGLGVFDKPNKYGLEIGRGKLDYGVLEEFAISLLNLERPGWIKSITKYNIGEFYSNIDNYIGREVKDIYFIHEHIPINEAGHNPHLMRLKYKRKMLELGVPNEQICLDNSD